MTGERCPETGRFLPRNRLGGRRKGARNKLSEAFIAALADVWERDGPAVIEEVRKTSPATFLRLVAAVVVKAYKPDGSVEEQYHHLTDAELVAEIERLQALVEGESQSRPTLRRDDEASYFAEW